MLDTSYFLLFLLPDVAVFILVGLFVRVSLSLLVLVAVPLAEAVFVKVGLLLFVILLVTLVLGPSYSPLWPYCGWDSSQNNPAPKPGIYTALYMAWYSNHTQYCRNHQCRWEWYKHWLGYQGKQSLALNVDTLLFVHSLLGVLCVLSEFFCFV